MYVCIVFPTCDPELIPHEQPLLVAGGQELRGGNPDACPEPQAVQPHVGVELDLAPVALGAAAHHP
eukprot:scaffold55616_cov24-Prasinocladus_malaysianus.AAC.1